ncbi:MAG: exodeoxyribonuclease V subunit alpha [Moraxellaceae bacterium]|nr:exodeoxyribonuclease V subunit alpha [Moraxellaceae bacterium]MDP1776476.1 exodeoxyribonuclease V subunit alpha [Moraxellaceae bacterium]
MTVLLENLRPLDLALMATLKRLCPQADDTALTLAGLASWQHAQGHLRLSLHDQVSAKHGLAVLKQSLLNSGFVATADQLISQPFVLDDDSLYLLRAWRDEHFVAEQLRQRVASLGNTALPLSADVVSVLDQLFPPSTDIDWQRRACDLAVQQPFSVITGGPGTGKTTTVVKLLGLLQFVAFQSGQPLRIALAAPTGKAAARLNESIRGAVAQLPLPAEVRAEIPLQVMTVHRLLGAQGQERQFRHHQRNPLLLDVLVIDEASMLDLSLFASILAALPAHARLILLGDKDQLASVEAGAVLGDVCASLQAQVLMLQKSHRFDGERGIGRLAKDVRDGVLQPIADYAPDVATVDYANLADGYRDYWQLVQQTPEDNESAREQWARQVIKAFESYRVLTAVREGRFGVEGVNEHCLNQLCDGRTPKQQWYVGRPVLITRNDYSLGLMNGDIGITLWLPDDSSEDGKRLRVAFPSNDAPDQLRWLLPSRLPPHQTVFAMTVHKSQGSEFDQVAFVMPDYDVPVLTRELVYTAVTRPKQRLLLCVYSPVWELAINRNTMRTSGLRKRLFFAQNNK